MNKILWVTLGALVLAGLISTSEALFSGSKHCTWHGTAPICMPSCPKDKKKIPGTESKCGPNAVACCITNKKFVCCPNEWQGNAANAMAVAKE
ncbi:uncharacterized protein LOC129582221 [Paramacrobiotus metropolitanus]|uniref:uncharacterized protein LOC129582221 n=1 Tax=Paramacrobiotus metropolitanus TaxID=2943436 RepID=UPI0024456A36|nr:uncharacterized protein LOC129582221 [Paramacrobiotus metropolitanus]